MLFLVNFVFNGLIYGALYGVMWLVIFALPGFCALGILHLFEWLVLNPARKTLAKTGDPVKFGFLNKATAAFAVVAGIFFVIACLALLAKNHQMAYHVVNGYLNR